VRRARAVLDRHMVNPIGIVVTGMRDSSRYGYDAYTGETPTLNVDLHNGASAGEQVEVRRLAL
jgi:hypothetical protein